MATVKLMAYYNGRLMTTDKYGKLFNGEKAPKDFQPCKDHSKEKVKEGSCCKEQGNGK